MAFLTANELAQMGFKKIGENVKVSSRASIYRPYEIEIGDNTRIDDFCLISGRVIIGRNVHIAAFSNICAGECSITFEDFSGLAYGCHIFTGSDDYSGKFLTNPTIPIELKGLVEADVVLRKHVIVGTNSIVFPGVIIAEGCAIGAMTLVTKSTDPWGIYFGIPAKRLKNRKKDLLELEKKYLSDYV
ncbi:acyltransferase [Yersinia sp. 2466 StPb PI]|uniref:acyltransferase n=1 Tax=unclassified Yersinia (in: enterobacteria) TaxID=2653513 RepID=UPI00355C7549